MSAIVVDYMPVWLRGWLGGGKWREGGIPREDTQVFTRDKPNLQKRFYLKKWLKKPWTDF